MVLISTAFAFPAPIINGQEATQDEFPMAGALLMSAHLDLGSYGEMDYKGLVCSSTLIAPDVVLLAAHCVDPDAFTYGMGEMTDVELVWSRQADLTDWDGTGSPRDWPDDAVLAWGSEMNEDFDIMAMQTGVAENFDVGLVFLDEALTDAPLATLVTEDEDELVVEGAEVSIVGWGQQEATSGWESPPPGTYAIKMWGDSVLGEVGASEFQVGPDDTDVRKCHGDSGGPTFLEVGGELRQIGITSHAYDQSDCNRTGGVDTRVGAYLDWIDATMVAACEDGSRAWCEEEGILPPGWTAEAIADVGGGEEEVAAGCGCSAGGSPGGLLGVLSLALAWRRRR